MDLWTRLAFGKATLNRVLCEMVLEDVGRQVLVGIPIARALVAGGGRGRGSEQRLLDLKGLNGKPGVIVGNIDRTVEPDLVTNLASPWPFKESSFDLVHSTWVLEHIESPQAFFREAYMVLRPGGFLVMAVPFIHPKHGSPFDYWRYTDTALISLARSYGFRRVAATAVSGGPFVACLSLLWPFVGLPVVGLLLFFLGKILDHALVWASRITGRAQQLVTSYPLGYVVWAQK
jgi:SAM-dependent methyltransferase